MTMRWIIGGLAALMLLLGACGDDDDGGSDATAGDVVDDTGAGDSGGDDSGGDGTDSGSDDSDVEPSSSGTGGGTITIGGTPYEFVADTQCGIYPSQNQYYVSGSLTGVQGGELAYSRDDEVHTLRVDLEDGTYRVLDEDADISSTIDGNTITGTATLSPRIGDPVEAEFSFVC